MEQRLANTWRMTVNEKKFIETALHSDLRIDGRRPFDYRELTIKFGSDTGSSEVHLGQTHVMGFVTAQLVQPYRDRPNEGTLSIYTEFSPMADPSFEAGRPGESAVELGRIVDRGLRESRAIDTESLSVIPGKFVWSLRVDLHILDNGGNLVDAANIAAIASLLTFRIPECSVKDGQEVIVHPAEEIEPRVLQIHHLPIAVTFAIFSEENLMVIDPTHFEEAVMGGRLTATLNANGDVCAIQKAGGVGVMQSVIMQSLRIASVKASDITSKIRKAVDSYNASYNADKSLRKKCLATAAVVEVSELSQKGRSVTQQNMDEIKSDVKECDEMRVDYVSSEQVAPNKRESKPKSFLGGPSSWDPYSKGIDSDELKLSLASPGAVTSVEKQENIRRNKPAYDNEPNESTIENDDVSLPEQKAHSTSQENRAKTLVDAVKPKHKRKKKALGSDASQKYT